MRTIQGMTTSVVSLISDLMPAEQITCKYFGGADSAAVYSGDVKLFVLCEGGSGCVFKLVVSAGNVKYSKPP